MSELFDLRFLADHAHYFLFIVLMMTGLYIVVDKTNLVKKIVGLNIFQVSVFMFYISIGKVSGGTAPILPMDDKFHVDTEAMAGIAYSNPLPHVLILTAIVVGIATTSLGLALIVRIREAFDTIDEEDITHIEQDMTREDNAKHGNAMGGMA
ncbi:Na+/H+ antiporter subunit C [Amylibacter marinus]|uniref:Na+/H+ antiporter subunit C n=1 Tax=Amylibacter marinus TaxID=1475483 RepID=A0ABQ5VYB3_9RHOB|nr:cation:proton antiporter subunit C [Amylibacter marinus]GLQ36265.1 Na+/H+ antiporter subunit C [Amylibacter marinus]